MKAKLWIGLSIILVILGFNFLWVGLNQQTEQLAPSLSTIPETPSATSSARFAERATHGISSKGQPASGWEGEKVLVTEVVDGDTIKVEGDITVRLLGIDTPETKDPRKSVQCFGKEASNKTKELLVGKMVILEKDVTEADIYKRLLRYIFLPVDPDSIGVDDGKLLFVNDYLIREGYARALTYPPDVKYTERFLEAQKDAKENSRGLWGECLW